MATSSCCNVDSKNTKNVDESVKKFFDFFGLSSPKSLTSPDSPKISSDPFQDPVSDLRRSTNPFLSPSVVNENVIDTKCFFDALFDNEGDLICLDDPADPPKYQNPFLEGLVDITSAEHRLLPPEVAEAPCSDGQDFLGEFEALWGSAGQPETGFVDETSLEVVNECQIDSYFDRCQWKEREFVTFRISNVYHLNKFWIVPRYRELEIFMEYLREFYTKNKQDFLMEKPTVNMYCVVHHNNAFYRGLIVKPLPNDKFRYKVYLMDYGSIMLVHVDNVYHLSNVLYSIPQFAIRTSLAYVAPKRTQVWTSEVVTVFEEFGQGKALMGEIVHVDRTTRCLHLNVADMPTDASARVRYVNESLMEEGYAKFNFDPSEPAHVQFDSKVDNLYVFPTFGMLETGGVPGTVAQFERMQENTTAFNIVYGRYCTLK